MKRRFQVAAAERGSAFVPVSTHDLHRLLAPVRAHREPWQHGPLAESDLQIEAVKSGTLSGCSVTAHQHLDGTLSLSYGPHRLGRYDATGTPLSAKPSTELRRVHISLPPSPVSLSPKTTGPIGEGTTLKPDIFSC